MCFEERGPLELFFEKDCVKAMDEIRKKKSLASAMLVAELYKKTTLWLLYSAVRSEKIKIVECIEQFGADKNE